MGKYTLLQLPALLGVAFMAFLLKKIIGFPVFICWAAIALWAVKDLAMFPFVWKSYDSYAGGERPPWNDREIRHRPSEDRP